MAETATFPTLPQGHKRFTVEQLLIELGPAIGLRAGALHALLHMMKRTAPDDWTRPDREPIYFAAQDATAASLGKTPRALYNTERQLEALGFIERRVKGNGHRSPHGGCGIVFSKLIAMVPDLLNLSSRLMTEARERRSLRNRRSALARHVRRHVENAGPVPHPRVAEAAERLALWPAARELPRMSIDALSAHVEEVKSLCETLDALVRDHRDSSAEADENFVRHIQENNHEISHVSCNDDAVVEPNGSTRCLEKKRAAAGEARKAQFVRRLTPGRLFDLAGEDMRSAILRSRGSSPALREAHLIDAAAQLLPVLGINHSAWEDAIDAMGPYGATLAVLLIDANRTHPRSPVRNPGGALRAWTRRHRGGGLNMVGSLIGLARRRGI